MSTDAEHPPAHPHADQVKDDRRPSWGLGRVVMVIFWAFGVWTTANAIIDLFHLDDEPLGPALTALLAGLVYLLAALGITHNGKRMRILGWTTVTLELIGPLMVGMMSVGISQLSVSRSAWANCGADYYYLPLIIPIIGLIWLWWSNPRRIVELAEQIERPSRHRRRDS